jgi:hypothetical protein
MCCAPKARALNLGDAADPGSLAWPDLIIIPPDTAYSVVLAHEPSIILARDPGVPHHADADRDVKGQSS